MKPALGILFLILMQFVSLSCEEKQTDTLFLQKSPEETGIYFQNKLISTPELNILNYIYYYNGGGVAASDFNNDGLIDLYFTGNQTADKLYINTREFKFEDVTSDAGINNAGNWTTGVTTVDINHDGLMDIYVCKVGDYHAIQGKNLLYINQGPDKNGIPKFVEDAASYGLEFKGFSTQAAFFDYDLDGDLDMFLMNHSVNPNLNYGKGEKRFIPDLQSGDKLFENKNGRFADVSEDAGIIQSKIGYGLGISVSDLNNDGYPDLYIGNDFYENDYLYINRGDKTFDEIIQKNTHAIGHTTHYSMGNDIADINNDGNTDIISVDMLPEDLVTYKTSGTEFNYQIYQNYIQNGYSYQYMQNTLHLNNGNETFSETGYLSGIAATEWSWSPLIGDYDNDGLNDLFISNGIPGATNDMDFINFIANESIQKSLGQGMDEKAMAFIEKIPAKKEVNYFFRNMGNSEFEPMNNTWASISATFSNGAVYADLDNDGDLDIVVNNINEPAMVLENTLGKTAAANFVSVKLEGRNANKFGIGSRIEIYSDGHKMVKENFTTRGYLSATAPIVHFGLGEISEIDSLKIVWPDKTFETHYKLKASQMYTFQQRNAQGNYYEQNQLKSSSVLVQADPLFSFKHAENRSLEFNRNPLTPFASSNEGPGIAVADINKDGLEDVVVGGAKGQPSQLFLQQKDGSFSSSQEDLFESDALSEDIALEFFDANGDEYPDLIILSGGNEFLSGAPLYPRLYMNNKGVFRKDDTQFKVAVNGSDVKSVDIDNDGDLDICLLSNTLPHQFGRTPQQFIFENDGNGQFTNITSSFAPELTFLGNCTSQYWIDLNGDSFQDLIVGGDWMPVSVFMNDGKQLTLQKDNGLENTNGLWNVVKAADFDDDGDLDIVAGNWGANSRLQANIEEPLRLYSVDANDNGQDETIITYFYQGEETTLASKDELVKQLPGINKNFLSYADFANADINSLFSEEILQNANKKEVYILKSSYFENLGDYTFKQYDLPFKAQISTVNDIAVSDFNKDGKKDLLLVGNNFEISTQLSRLDASHGLLLLNESNGKFKEADTRFFDIPGASRDIEFLNYQDDKYLLIARNNDQPVFLKIKK
ncbi:MAG: VCBS repeat-containing protein [Flavobacteriaceae bacterium]|nr:VCBS repeat-containing protein [Flavobacteriaceae bacterium]